MKSVLSDAPISIEPSELPGHGRSVYYFPNPYLGGGKADIVYRISSATGESWYAALAEQNASARHRAFVMPDRTSVFVDGYVVRARNPMDWYRIQLDSVIDIAWTESGDGVVFLGIHGIAMYNRYGICWLRANCRHLYLRRVVKITDRHIFIEGVIDEDIVGKFPIAFDLYDSSEIHDRVEQSR
jgi:hypothetical protein